ncbi:hydrolase [Clostridium sp. CT7]|nr:hydrolase [Clostridium sp. CT7]
MIVVALGVITSMGTTTVLATPLDDSQAKYNQSHESVLQLEDKIQQMDNKIENIMNDRDNNSKKIDQAQKDIDQAQKDIGTAKENIKEEKDKFGERMRALYISGSNQSYIDILLKSKSFSDMLARVEAIKQVTDYDNKLIGELKDSQDRVQAKKDKIVSEKEKLVALNKENDSKLKQINDDKAKENVVVAQAKAQESKDASALKSQQDAQNAIKASAQAKLLADNKTTTTSNSSKPIPRGGGNFTDIVSFAEQFCGVPYVSGGTSPAGFDCSGLVQYVYAHFGVSLPRTTYDQVNVGTTVSLNSLQPGDLLFFGSASAPHHVAMYVGGGQMIEAPHTGAFVRVTSANRGDLSIAKRVR